MCVTQQKNDITKPIINANAKKLCEYLPATVNAENASGPKIGRRTNFPYTIFKPVIAKITKEPAINQCENLSIALNLVIVSPEKPLATFILPR